MCDCLRSVHSYMTFSLPLVGAYVCLCLCESVCVRAISILNRPRLYLCCCVQRNYKLVDTSFCLSCFIHKPAGFDGLQSVACSRVCDCVSASECVCRAFVSGRRPCLSGVRRPVDEILSSMSSALRLRSVCAHVSVCVCASRTCVCVLYFRQAFRCTFRVNSL